MKRIGLIGGLSPESTVEYYQYICREFNSRYGKLHFPEIVIRSINLQNLIECFAANEWDKVATLITNAVIDCEDAGADFAAICANTPHNAYDRISQDSPIKVLSIMEATAEAITAKGFKKVGLLGTKPTMEFGFFQKTFERMGIETLVPESEDRAYMDETIWNELSHGRITDKDRERHKSIIMDLVEQGVEGVILGCTELPLLIHEATSPVPLFDTARIHAQAIFEYAVRDE